jgi:hypothetical protein
MAKVEETISNRYVELFSTSFTHLHLRAVSWSVGTLAAAAFGREINVRGLENQAYDKNLTRWSAAGHLILVVHI